MKKPEKKPVSDTPFDLTKYTFKNLLEIRDNYSDCDEKAIAMIIDEKGIQLEKKLAESRAEIERLKNKNTASISAHMWAIMRHAFISGAHKGYEHGAEHKLLELMFTEFCNKDYPEAAEKEIERLAEIDAKDALIKQMLDTLEKATNFVDLARARDELSSSNWVYVECIAAIESAKGGNA